MSLIRLKMHTIPKLSFRAIARNLCVVVTLSVVKGLKTQLRSFGPTSVGPQDDPRGRILRSAQNDEMVTGFSLIETVIAIALGAIVTVMLVLTVSNGLKNSRHLKRVERLQANSIFIADGLSYWVKQAKVINVPSSSELELTLPDGTMKRFAKTGNALTLDATPLTSAEVVLTSLIFTELERSVRIAFSVSTKNGSETFSATTTAARRN